METSADVEIGVFEDDRAPTTPDLVRRARFLNLLGLTTPIANLGMTLVSPLHMRWFGVGAGVLFTAGLAWAWWHGAYVTAILVLAVHGVFVLAGLIDPRHPEMAARVWLALARVMGKVSGAVILPVVYFVAVTPLAWLAKLFGVRPLALPDASGGSYWTKRRPPPDDRFRRQF